MLHGICWVVTRKQDPSSTYHQTICQGADLYFFKQDVLDVSFAKIWMLFNVEVNLSLFGEEAPQLILNAG